MLDNILEIANSGSSPVQDEIFNFLDSESIFEQANITVEDMAALTPLEQSVVIFKALKFLVQRSKYIEVLANEFSNWNETVDFEQSITRLYMEHLEFYDDPKNNVEPDEFTGIGEDDSKSFDVANLTETVVAPYIFARNVVDAAKKGKSYSEWSREMAETEALIYKLAEETKISVEAHHFSGSVAHEFFKSEGVSSFRQYRLWYIKKYKRYVEDRLALYCLEHRVKRNKINEEQMESSQQ